MNVAFLLHLYQPSTQSESEFKVVATSCYVPLLKLIKNRSDAKFTLNIPLSLLEQFEKFGYMDLIAQIKDLVEADKVELVGSAAYHPLLTKISGESVYKQIILNEYALGYYFGTRQGFEGEASIMVKDIKGFFSPEMAVNANLLQVLTNLGYDWVAVDTFAIPEEVLSGSKHNGVFQIKDGSIKIVKRDTTLSNLLSFKRNTDISDVMSYIQNNISDSTGCTLIAMDGEAFGHHNREGIYLLDSLLDALKAFSISVDSVSACVSDILDPVKISSINESTWALTSYSSDSSKIYPFWCDSANELHVLLWEIFEKVETAFLSAKFAAPELGYENIAIWNETALKKIDDKNLVDSLVAEILAYKSMQSDQFWWASNKTIDDKLLFSPIMIRNALATAKKFAEVIEDATLAAFIHEKGSEIVRKMSK